jgi:hypothetical protein
MIRLATKAQSPEAPQNGFVDLCVMLAWWRALLNAQILHARIEASFDTFNGDALR